MTFIITFYIQHPNIKFIINAYNLHTKTQFKLSLTLKAWWSHWTSGSKVSSITQAKSCVEYSAFFPSSLTKVKCYWVWGILGSHCHLKLTLSFLSPMPTTIIIILAESISYVLPPQTWINPSALFAVTVTTWHLNCLLRFDVTLTFGCRHNFKRP
jgi:hypothetical protein